MMPVFRTIVTNILLCHLLGLFPYFTYVLVTGHLIDHPEAGGLAILASIVVTVACTLGTLLHKYG